MDLRGVSFALPGGIVALACIAEAARSRGFELDVLAPASDDVARYVSRMGLGEVLDRCGARHTLPVVNHHNRADVLVECRWARAESIGDVSELVNERLWEAGVDARTTDVVTMAVYELADNVRTHAASEGGFICAQTYELGTPRERLDVAVGDAGQGIRASLEQRLAPGSDEAALRLAITERVSGLNSERGLGLHYVARDISRAGGRLSMVSGGACLQHTTGRTSTFRREPTVGTLVGVRVPVGQMSQGAAT